MAGIRGLYKIQMGKETTLGTEVAATSYWRGKGILTDESEVVYPAEDVGIIGGVGRTFVPMKDGTLPLDEVEATFEQLPYLLNMGVKGVAGVKDGSGSGYIYTYPFPYNTTQSPYTYTFEAGDNQQAELMTGCFAEEIVISGAAGEGVMMAATLRGWPGGTTTFTAGQSVPTVEEMIFGKTKLYVDDVASGWGSTQVEESFLSFELTISNVFKPVWSGDGAGLYYVFVKVNSGYEVTLNYTIEHDAVAVAERAKRRAGTPRAIQIITTGATLTTAGTSYSVKTMICNVCGTYMEPEVLDEDEGNIVAPFTLKGHYDATIADRGEVIVVNELSALP